MGRWKREQPEIFVEREHHAAIPFRKLKQTAILNPRQCVRAHRTS
jgi:hypothetical protein